MLMEKEELSVKQLFRDLTRELQVLVKETMELARLETMEKVVSARKGLILAGGGGAVIYAGLLTLLGSAVFALAQIIPLWLSAFIISVLVLAGGGIMLFTGIKYLKRASTPPGQTMEVLKEERQWARHEMKT